MIEVSEIVNGCSTEVIAEFSNRELCSDFCKSLHKLGFDLIAI